MKTANINAIRAFSTIPPRWVTYIYEEYGIMTAINPLMGRYGALGWFKRPGKAEKTLALEALEKVGMMDFVNRQISQLSGGQQQRVFLARALVQDAQIYFMDEPFQGVDATTERAILTLLQELRSMGKPWSSFITTCRPYRTTLTGS